MKKSLFIMALGAIALTSCSQDEIIEVQKDAISFAAFNENASRATVTTTNTITDFKVYGVHYDATPTYTTYIDGLVCERATTGSAWVNHDSGYYWPMGTMDFYAVSPSSNAIAMGTLGAVASNEAKIENYTITDALTGNTDDLLYAITAEETKKAEDVVLHFKHALSQIAFQVGVAESFTQSVTVEVNSISVVNVKDKGTFAYPKAETLGTTEAVDADQLWTVADDAVAKTYTVEPLNYSVAYTKGTEAFGAETESMLLLPQAITASTVATWTAGSHFILDVDIKDTATGIYLVKDKPTYVPVNIDWRPGVKYIYKFTYADGSDGGVDVDGKDQLYKIKFACTVAPFAETTQSVDVNVP